MDHLINESNGVYTWRLFRLYLAFLFTACALPTVGHAAENLIQNSLPTAEEIASLPADGGSRYNRLIHEKSPYLLQHASNPVDWYPWGEEAFALARKLDKPIFLSIGYSTCHWCHVMEHESFEDHQVAGMMNRYFVCIKVDREERPDIDHVYMTASQSMTGRGGWPMTILMTPEKMPFFAGTYLPRRGSNGRPGMLELIPQAGRLWQQDRERLLVDARKVTQMLEQSTQTTAPNPITEETLDSVWNGLVNAYDPDTGGFGRAPKFPTPHRLTFLLRYWKRSGNAKALAMVEKTLREMRNGGMYDQLGYGFHRYSTDSTWLLPHFEKMLYDQALLTIAYVETYQATGNAFYGNVAGEILTYVQRDMTSPEGGFYSGEDADSEGEEGLFYLWEPREISAILGKQVGDFFNSLFNIENGGNFRDQSSGKRTGRSIPHLQKSLEELAKEHEMTTEALAHNIDIMRTRLFAYRENRIHPLKDDKILTDWNGLMIAAMAKAGRALNDERYIDSAARAADFALSTLRQKNGRLWKRYRAGEAGLPAHLEDYAFLSWGLIELYEATFEVKYLRAAIDLTATMLDLFWDDAAGGFFMTANDGEKLLIRGKEIYDGAIPSGNSVAVLNLLRLHRMVAKEAYRAKAEAMLKTFSGSLNKAGTNYCQMMNAVDFSIGPSVEIVVAGTPGSDDLALMLSTIRGVFAPNKVVLFRPDNEEHPEISGLAEYTSKQSSIDGKATAYVCRNFACKAPETDPDLVRKELEGSNP